MTPKPTRRPRPHRALDETEREQVLGALHCERFVDKAPAQVWARFWTRESTTARFARCIDFGGVRRGPRAPEPTAPSELHQPELLAEAPNQVWSWDITKLRGPVKWTYYYLYVILDTFSRYVVGWMLAHRESAALAQRLIAESCRKQHIEPDQLTLHADRGSSMRSKPVALLLSDLGVTKTHSRPYASNDNPYSESQFKTLKYCPQFPSRFGSAEDGRLFCGCFFGYYNYEHRHSGIGLMTPADVHYGRAEQALRRSARDTSRRSAGSSRTFRSRNATTSRFASSSLDQPAAGKNDAPGCCTSPLAATSIPGVPPFSASRNGILIDADVARPDLTSLPTIIEAH